jgi:hypothetical protein
VLLWHILWRVTCIDVVCAVSSEVVCNMCGVLCYMVWCFTWCGVICGIWCVVVWHGVVKYVV